MAHMELKFKLGDKQYEVDKVTLGESRLIATEFGVDDLEQFQWHNVRYLSAMVYLGIKRAEPYLTHEQLMERVDAVDIAELMESVQEWFEESAAAIAALAAADPTGGGDDEPSKSGSDGTQSDEPANSVPSPPTS